MKQRYHQLDALRGVAALSVLAQHLLTSVSRELGPTAGWIDAIALNWFQLGLFGVTLFFLISGFVIPSSLSGPSALRRFVVGRFFRLYPAFWLSLALLVAVLIVAQNQAVSTLSLVANMTMAPKLFGEEPLSGVFWTLLIELVFYAACAGLFVSGLLTRAWVLFVVGLVGVAAMVVPVLLSLPTQFLSYHLSFLFLGALLRQAKERGGRVWWMAAILATVQLGALPVATGMFGGVPYAPGAPIGMLLAVPLAIVVFVVAMRLSAVPGVVFLNLGAWSYSLYLVHVPVAIAVKAWVVFPHDAWTATAFVVVTTCLSVVLAAAIYSYVEAPFIALGKRLVGNTTRQTAEVAP